MAMKSVLSFFSSAMVVFFVSGAFAGNASAVAPQADNQEVHVPQAQTNHNDIARTPSCRSPIDWRQAKGNQNKRVAVRGVVAEYRFMPEVNGRPTWINIGNEYPVRDRLSVVIWGYDRSEFGGALSDVLTGREICVIGTVKMRDGTPQIVLRSPNNLFK